MKYKIYKWLHRQIAKSKFLVRIAIALKFHCRDIISQYLNSPISSPKDEEAIVGVIKISAPQSSVFFDIGANKGLWTDIYLQYTSSSTAGYLYEPLPDLARKLREKYKGKNIFVGEYALAETIGRADFYRAKVSTHSSLASLPDSRQLTVNVLTLDTEAEKHKLNYIDFVKIDTEGWDGYVLRGGQGLLSMQKIGILQFEFSAMWRGAGCTLTYAINLLESFGYKVFFAHKNGLYALRYCILGEDSICGDFVAFSPKWNWVAEKLYKGVL